MTQSTNPSPEGKPAPKRSPAFVPSGGFLVAVLFGVGLVSLIGGMAYFAFRPATSNKDQAILAVQEMITTSKLGLGVTAKFNPPEWTHFETLSDGKFYITGWLQVITPYGTANSYTYTSKLYMNNNGDWVFDTLDLLPQ